MKIRFSLMSSLFRSPVNHQDASSRIHAQNLSISALDLWRWYADMVFFDGKLYAITNDGDLLAMDVGTDDATGEPRSSRVELAVEGWSSNHALQEYTLMRYLVVRPHGGGLLMVCRIMLDHGSTAHGFAIFEVDLLCSWWV
jgi:hypothetical protein